MPAPNPPRTSDIIPIVPRLNLLECCVGVDAEVLDQRVLRDAGRTFGLGGTAQLLRSSVWENLLWMRRDMFCDA